MGNYHVGPTIQQLLTIQNTAVADGYSEGLDANFGSVATGLTAGGSVGLLPSGGSSTAMSLALNTSTAGAKGGNVTINFTSDGAGTSGLGTTSLGTQTISVTGNVYSGQGVWNTNGGGTWGEFSNWTTLGGVPGIDGGLSAGDTAVFGTALVSRIGHGEPQRRLAPREQPDLQLDGKLHDRTGNGRGLNLDNGAGTATVTVTSGNHAISSPVTLDSNAVSALPRAASLTISGAIGESGGSH